MLVITSKIIIAADSRIAFCFLRSNKCQTTQEKMIIPSIFRLKWRQKLHQPVSLCLACCKDLQNKMEKTKLKPTTECIFSLGLLSAVVGLEMNFKNPLKSDSVSSGGFERCVRSTSTSREEATKLQSIRTTVAAGQISESLFFLSLYFLLLVFHSSPPLLSTLCHLPSLPHLTLLNLPLHPPPLPFHPLLLLASVALILFCCPKFSSPSDPLLFLVSGPLVLLFSIVTLLIFVTKEVEKNCCKKKKIHIIYALSFYLLTLPCCLL